MTWTLGAANFVLGIQTGETGDVYSVTWKMAERPGNVAELTCKPVGQAVIVGDTEEKRDG
jgi:hypothetical protein